MSSEETPTHPVHRLKHHIKHHIGRAARKTGHHIGRAARKTGHHIRRAARKTKELAHSLPDLSFLRINKLGLYVAIPLIIVLLVGYSLYMANLEDYAGEQNVMVYGQDKLESGSQASMRIVAVTHGTGEPIEGAWVTIKAKGKKDTVLKRETVLFEGRTNQQGSPEAAFTVPEGLEGDHDLLITVKSRHGSDEIIKSVKIERSYRILLTSDKPLYQPGQTMHIRTLSLRNADSKPADGKYVTIEVEDSKANKVFKKRVLSSEYGIAATNFTLANEINYGRYTIRALIGDYSAEKKVEVKKYVLPKFKVSLETEKPYYLPGQELAGTVNADYFFGKPANNAEVEIGIYTYEAELRQVGNVKGTTDSAGVYRFGFDLPSHFVGLPLEKGSALLFFNVSVTDQAGHTEEITSSVPVAQNPVKIELVPESGELQKDIGNVVYVITTYPDGKPAPSAVTVNGETIRTNEYGLGEFTITPQNFLVELRATASDDKGNKGSVSVQFPRDYVTNPRTPEERRRNERYNRDRYRTESVLLRVDRSVLDVGDAIRIDAFYTGQKGTVYVDVIKDGQTILTKALEVVDGRASLKLDLDESMAGTLELHAYKVLRNSDIVRDSRTIFVNHRKDIVLEIEPGKDSYLPGEEAQITFTTSKNDLPIQAAIGVNIVDESIFALQERETGFERLYFELEEDLMKPRYFIYGITLPELIYGSGPLPDEAARIQAGKVLMAAAGGEDRFTLTAHSRPEKEMEIQRQKDDYFNALFNVSKILLVLLPLVIFGLGMYDHRQRKKTLLEDLGLSVAMILGLTILGVSTLFAFSVLLYSSLGHGATGLIVSLAFLLAIAITAFLFFRAMKKNNFWLYLISGFLLPVEVLFAASVLTEVSPYLFRFFLVITFVLTLVMVAVGSSMIVLVIYGKKNNQNLLWMTLLLLPYTLVFVAFIFLGEYIGFPDLGDSLLWIALSALLIPLIYGAYVIDFVRIKSRVALPALITFLVSLVFFALLMALFFGQSDADLLMADRTDVLENQMMRAEFTEEKAIPDVDHVPVSATAEERPRVRQFFPETLYSNPEIITDEKGKAVINLEVADSITSWRITALANSLNGDVGSGNAGMIVFQDFFVDLDVPVSLTQGDEVSIPVSAFNYLEGPQSVRLEFQEEDWFELLDEPSKTLELNASEAGVVYFRIKAKRLGNNKLTVYAYGSEKSDAVSRVVEIVPDGKEYRISHSDRLDGRIDKTVSFPSDAIEGSERLFVKIYPSTFSQVVEGLDSMLRMPYGCFEQTSSITYPNLLILDYMKRTRQINPEIQIKAEQYVGTGYQRLMTFESNTDGGWTWFGPPEEANMMLSAYGLIEFHDMAEVYEIDEKIIERTQDYLTSRMKTDGSFEPEGRLHTSGIQADSGKMTSTCFVAWSLAYTGYDRLQNTVQYIETNVNLEKEGSYTLALCANALAHYDKKKAMPILDELDSRAVKTEKTIHWESLSREMYGRTVMGGEGKIKDMETTSLAALAYLEAGYHRNEVNRILTYIVSQKDSHGSWGTTFATILSLKALINTLDGNPEETDATIRIFFDGETVETIKIDRTNGDVLQLVELNEYVGEGDLPVGIEMNGEGNLFYQIVSAYHVGWDAVEMPPKDLISINLEYDRTTLSVNDVVTAKVNAAYHGEGFVNNAIIDLGIPPGFSVVSEDLQKAVENGIIEKYDVTGRQIIIYLRFLDNEGISLEYGLKAKYPVKAKTPKSSVYDYYNPDLRDETEPVEIRVE